jgi:flagellar basal body-associated protein FliL
MALSGSEEPGIEGEEAVEAEAEVEEETRAEVHALFGLEGFVVNLADTERNSFLRIGIELGLEHEPEAGHGGDDAVPTARMRDAILAVLSTWESDALLTQEGKAKLKEQLVAMLQERVPEMDVQEVYFTDFLVQR